MPVQLSIPLAERSLYQEQEGLQSDFKCPDFRVYDSEFEPAIQSNKIAKLPLLNVREYTKSKCVIRTFVKGDMDFGDGRLYLCTTGIYWVSQSNEEGNGLSSFRIPLSDVNLHALAKEFGQPTLYIQAAGFDKPFADLYRQTTTTATDQNEEDNITTKESENGEKNNEEQTGAAADEEDEDSSISQDEEDAFVEYLFCLEDFSTVEEAFDFLSGRLTEYSKLVDAEENSPSSSSEDEDTDTDQNGDTELKEETDEKNESNQ